jgi:hypothetical protein
MMQIYEPQMNTDKNMNQVKVKVESLPLRKQGLRLMKKNFP